MRILLTTRGSSGHGSTLGSLRHGVPLVVVPLLSVDQWANARAVERVGAGIALDADRPTRTVRGLPAPEVMHGLGAAVERVLAKPSYRVEARQIAAADRTAPSATTVVDELLSLARRR